MESLESPGSKDKVDSSLHEELVDYLERDAVSAAMAWYKWRVERDDPRSAVEERLADAMAKLELAKRLEEGR